MYYVEAMDLAEIGLTGIWQPASQAPTSGYLVVVLHGRGDSSAGFDWLRSALGLSGLSALLVDAPDAYYTGFSWYDLPPDQLPGIRRSRALLDRLFAWIETQGFGPERCFLLGFSQGCLMTLEFGGRFPERLAGYIGISGYCYDPLALLAEASGPAKGGDWLITHGTEDGVLEVGRTREQMRELMKGGFNLEYFEYRKEHTIDPTEELPLIREWIKQRMK
jgi:phospholipase/carboxylesterase